MILANRTLEISHRLLIRVLKMSEIVDHEKEGKIVPVPLRLDHERGDRINSGKHKRRQMLCVLVAYKRHYENI